MGVFIVRYRSYRPSKLPCAAGDSWLVAENVAMQFLDALLGFVELSLQRLGMELKEREFLSRSLVVFGILQYGNDGVCEWGVLWIHGVTRTITAWSVNGKAFPTGPRCAH